VTDVKANRLEGRVAVVTGGASGIGAATVELLRKSGAQVAVFDMSPHGLPEDVLTIQGDVTSSAEAGAAVARVESEFGRLDVLVCSAGVGGDSVRAVDMPDEEWRRVFAINCDGTQKGGEHTTGWYKQAFRRIAAIVRGGQTLEGINATLAEIGLPGLNRTKTDQDRNLGGPIRTVTAVRSSVHPNLEFVRTDEKPV